VNAVVGENRPLHSEPLLGILSVMTIFRQSVPK
jgi:hypothetical protein